MEWLIILIVIAGLMLVSSFLHLEHKFHLAKTVFLVLLLLLLVGSAYLWFSSNENDSPKGMVNSIYLYVSWLGDTGAKLFTVTKDSFSLVGNAIKMDNQTSQKIRDGRR